MEHVLSAAFSHVWQGKCANQFWQLCIGKGPIFLGDELLFVQSFEPVVALWKCLWGRHSSLPAASKMWGPSLWLVSKRNRSPFISLSHAWESRCTQQEREGEQGKEACLKPMGFVCLGKGYINTASLWQPHLNEWQKMSDLSKSLVAAFYWLLPSYLLSRQHFRV